MSRSVPDPIICAVKTTTLTASVHYPKVRFNRPFLMRSCLDCKNVTRTLQAVVWQRASSVEIDPAQR